jgi:lecithin:cholesterol acyltransferase
MWRMPELEPLNDLVIIIPGITGSVLTVNGKDVWGLSGRAIMRGVLSLGASVDVLELPDGFGTTLPINEGDGERDDHVVATRMFDDLHVIPGVWAPIKGYTAVHDLFTRRFKVTPATDTTAGNLVTFPYDWRLSNVVSARRLKKLVDDVLPKWQRTHPDAKLVLACHSMGGLVARWFLEVLGGAESTRWLITFGTPYAGALNALDTLVNGTAKGLGPIQKDLTTLVQSFPSMFELLPTYPCVGTGDGRPLETLSTNPCGLNPKRIAAAKQFHDTIAERVAARGGSTPYRIVAIKGIEQPTSQSALWTGEEVRPQRFYSGHDKGGDGTVPRPSSHPPEWASEMDGRTVFAAQQHGVIQDSDAVLSQIFGVLTARSGTWLGGEGLGLDVPTLTTAGDDLPITVTSENDTLALTAIVTPHDSSHVIDQRDVLKNEGGGRYTARFANLPEGTYQVTVRAASDDQRVASVSSLAIVWNANAR